jgi:crotonobetainyl-CoA:carnitine CoA-transferase CaiB-like acyl-CoA transferase
VPHRSGALTADVPTGLYAYAAIATALFARQQTGTGRHIDVSLMAGSAALLGHMLPDFQVNMRTPAQLNVPAGSFEAADGWMAIALVREDDWRRTCIALERPDWLEDPRFASFTARYDNRDALMAQMRPHIRTRPRADWLARLKANDVISDSVNSIGDWLANAHVQAVGAAVPAGVEHYHVARTPGAPAESDAALAPAPVAGQHTRDVLAECGLATDEIDRLFAEGVVS